MIRSLTRGLALACLLAVGACASLPPVSALPPPRPGSTVYDARIAKASADLARYCGALQAGLAIADWFASGAVAAAIDQAEAVASTICTEPPQDVAGAAVTAARAVTILTTAQAAQ